MPIGHDREIGSANAQRDRPSRGRSVILPAIKGQVEMRALERSDPLPILVQLDGFVADYEAGRGAPFSDHEHEVLAAGPRWIASYGARCQRSDDVLGIFPDVDHSRGAPRFFSLPLPGSTLGGARRVRANAGGSVT